VDSFDDEGVFWLPGNHNQQVAGRLKFDPVEGATLSLIGGFGDLPQQFNDQARMIRIHGVAGKRYLTLDHCFNTNTTFEMPGTSRQTYYVNRVITGAHFGVDEDLTFDRCAIDFDQLPGWVRRSGVTVSMQTQTPELTFPPDKVMIEFTPVQDEVVQIDNDSLRLASTWRLGGDNITDTFLNQGVHLELRYPSAQPLDTILADVKYLQDLLTLATTAPTVPLEITLWREDITREFKPGEQRPQAMNYYAGQLAAKFRLDAPQSPGHILFQFDAIGGLATIARWVKVAREYHTVLGSLLSIRYAAGLYVENRFNNVISAAESFHRLRFPNRVMPEDEFRTFRRELIKAVPKEHRNWLGSQLQYSNEPRLRHRLSDMAAYAGEAFASLYAEPEPWVTVVTESRNRLTHHDKERALDLQSGDLYFLTESVFVLVMLCLFRECDVDAQALTAIGESGSIQFLRDKLSKIIPRLTEQIEAIRATHGP
jgi:hypothetical protein